MIEAYAFLAMFTIQVVATSVLYPAWFIRYSRRRLTSIPTESLAQLYPGVDVSLAQERFLAQYRALNITIAVPGLLLLGWLFRYMRRPDWNVVSVEVLATVYCMAQMVLPLALVAGRGVGFNKMHRHSLLQRKRKAILQPRGLFDFVSPFMVFLAVSLYFLFVAFVIYILIYIQQRPYSKSQGLTGIGAITLVYALQAFVVYAKLYGKKSNPFETHARRVRTIGLVVKSCVYSCIACVTFVSLNFAFGLLGWQRWEPFALSVFFVITALISLIGMIPPSDADGYSDGLSSGGKLAPGTRNLSA